MWLVCHLWASVGQLQDLPAVERPIYNLVQEGKSGFYYPVPKDKSILSDDNVPSLETESNDTSTLPVEQLLAAQLLYWELQKMQMVSMCCS